MSGGDGGANDGAGGYGGYAGPYNDEDSSDLPENILISPIGSVKINYTPHSPAGNTGSNPLNVTSNLTVPTLSEPFTEPETGTAYLVEYNEYMYISDGDGVFDNETSRVTGIKIHSGCTLTLDSNIFEEDTFTYFELAKDFINFGTVTTSELTVDVRGGLEMYANTFINHGTLAIQGTEPGQNGGNLYIYTQYGVFNFGPINTFGSDNADNDGGQGGDVEMRSTYTVAQNMGIIDAHGGQATGDSGDGGDGGYFELYTENTGTVFNSGKIYTYGGTGIANGGNGNSIFVGSEYGDTFNTAALNSYGGDGGTGTGGDGNEIWFYTVGKNLKNIGNMNCYGGSTTSLDGGGGSGGIIYFDIYNYSDMYKPSNKPKIEIPVDDIGQKGSLQIAGNMKCYGGNVSTALTATGFGGDGGGFEFYLEGHNTTIELLGYGSITGNGGDGNIAGDGGEVILAAINKTINNVPITLKGGNGINDGSDTMARGGYGGIVNIGFFDIFGYETKPKFSPMLGFIENSGNIDLSGGTNINTIDEEGRAGSGGQLLFFSSSTIDNTGNIICNGGHDIGTAGGVTGFGGHGGGVMMLGSSDVTKNHGEIHCNGGNGAYNGGNAAYSDGNDLFDESDYYGITIVNYDAVDNPAPIIANGRNANVNTAGSHGGSGGGVRLITTLHPNAVVAGPIIANGGTGETPGCTKNVLVGGIATQIGTCPPPPVED